MTRALHLQRSPACGPARAQCPLCLGLPANHTAGSTVYVCIPKVSQLEWHPFTVATARSGEFVLILKAAGDWTAACLRLAEASGGTATGVTVHVEAPYPSAVCGRVEQQLQAGNSVVLVAGGSGIAAMLPLLGAAATVQDKRPSLVWITRSSEVCELMPHGCMWHG